MPTPGLGVIRAGGETPREVHAQRSVPHTYGGALTWATTRVNHEDAVLSERSHHKRTNSAGFRFPKRHIHGYRKEAEAPGAEDGGWRGDRASVGEDEKVLHTDSVLVTQHCECT